MEAMAAALGAGGRTSGGKTKAPKSSRRKHFIVPAERTRIIINTMAVQAGDSAGLAASVARLRELSRTRGVKAVAQSEEEYGELRRARKAAKARKK